jgi:hypothetical protein
MDNKNQYIAASLSQNLVDDIQSMEENFRKKTNKEVILIAYEKDGDRL